MIHVHVGRPTHVRVHIILLIQACQILYGQFRNTPIYEYTWCNILLG